MVPMIRTRDFLIYMCTLVFLVSAIGYTILGDMQQQQTIATELAAAPSAAFAYGAVAEASEFDREGYVEWLRGKIAAGAGADPEHPVTLETVDETPPEAAIVATTPVTERAAQYCAPQQDIGGVLGSWDPNAAEVRVVEGARIVLGAESRPLLQLPIRTVRAATDSCLPHVIIGVTEDGALIGNSDTPAYRAYGPDMLVGYALDGLPIYGPSADAALDACGGTNAPTGYRYHVRADEPFILGCFAAPPASFIQ